MKKIVSIVLTIVLMISISACGQPKATVYRFESFHYTNDHDDPFQALTADYISEQLSGTFIEIKADGTTAVYSPNNGYSEKDFFNFLEEISDKAEMVTEGDCLSFSDDEMIMLFIKATKSEQQYYRDMVKKWQQDTVKK